MFFDVFFVTVEILELQDFVFCGKVLLRHFI